MTQTDSKTLSTTGKILIVDDTPGNLELLIQTLGQDGYQVFAAPSGKLAIDFAKRNFPDLILLDIAMPEMDGFEVCQYLKDDPETKEIPIIFLSSAIEALDKVTAFSLGAVDYITKPFESAEVLARVKTHMTLSRHQNQLVELVAERTIQLSEVIENLKTEVAERQSLHAKLEQEEAFIRDVFDSAADAIIVFDENYRIIRLNRRTEQSFGYNANELLDHSLDILIPDYFRETLRELLLDFTQSSKRTLRIGSQEKFWGQHKSGSQIPAVVTISKLYNQNEALILFVMNDITDRLAIEKVRRELETERELRQVKSQFFSMIAHDFRNPLAAIRLSADSFKRYAKRMTTEQMKQRAERVIGAVDRMNSLLEDVLVSEQLGQSTVNYDLKETDLVEFCYDVFEELREILGKNHDMHYEVDTSPILLAIDKRLVHRLIGNLLSNAIKYSPDGGLVLLNLVNTNETVIIKVSDTGIGIPPEDLENLFELFHRAKNVGSIKGTGIGLAIVKQIVDIHSGKIGIESHVNKGTTFTISFPRVID